MSGKKKANWNVGDIFLIPLLDESYSVGQILIDEVVEFDSVVCAFTNLVVKEKKQVIKVEEKDFISVLFTTNDLLDRGVWQVVGNSEVPDFNRYVDIAGIRASGYVGAKVIGSANINKFMNAISGLVPWNSHYKPDYFDELLLPSCKKPDNLS